jgi:hypothetical protein
MKQWFLVVANLKAIPTWLERPGFEFVSEYAGIGGVDWPLSDSLDPGDKTIHEELMSSMEWIDFEGDGYGDDSCTQQSIAERYFHRACDSLHDALYFLTLSVYDPASSRPVDGIDFGRLPGGVSMIVEESLSGVVPNTASLLNKQGLFSDIDGLNEFLALRENLSGLEDIDSYVEVAVQVNAKRPMK